MEGEHIITSMATTTLSNDDQNSLSSEGSIESTSSKLRDWSKGLKKKFSAKLRMGPKNVETGGGSTEPQSGGAEGGPPPKTGFGGRTPLQDLFQKRTEAMKRCGSCAGCRHGTCLALQKLPCTGCQQKKSCYTMPVCEVWQDNYKIWWQERKDNLVKPGGEEETQILAEQTRRDKIALDQRVADDFAADKEKREEEEKQDKLLKERIKEFARNKKQTNRNEALLNVYASTRQHLFGANLDEVLAQWLAEFPEPEGWPQVNYDPWSRKIFDDEFVTSVETPRGGSKGATKLEENEFKTPGGTRGVIGGQQQHIASQKTAGGEFLYGNPLDQRTDFSCRAKPNNLYAKFLEGGVN